MIFLTNIPVMDRELQGIFKISEMQILGELFSREKA